MEYSLALQLKNAGFAFEFCPDLGDPAHDPLGCERQMPTLEELIEACEWGENEFLLGGRFKTWSAQSYNKMTRVIGEGEDPQTAVARLWLALNQK